MSPLSPYLAFLRRHRWTYVVALAVSVAASLVYLVVTPRSYRAVATTIVPYREAEADLRFGTGRVFPVQYAFVVNNHLEVMRSGAVHEELLRRLKEQQPDLFDELFRQDGDDGAKPLGQRGLLRALGQRLRASSKDDTGVLRLEASAPSAEGAARLANLAMSAYADIQHGVNQRSLVAWLDYLRTEEERWSGELELRDEELERFRSEESLASLVDETRALMQEAVRVEGEIVSTQGHAAAWDAKRKERTRQLQELRGRIDRELTDTSAPLIQELRDQIAEDEAWYSFLQAGDSDASSPELQRLGQRIADSRASLLRFSEGAAKQAGEGIDPLGLARSLLDQVRGLDSEVAGGRARIARLERELGELRQRLNAMPSLNRRQDQLTRDRDLSAEIAKLVKQRRIEAEVESRRGETRLSAINAAVPPRSPASPRPLLALLSGVLLALLAGTAVSALEEILDPRLQDGEEAAQLAGVPVLARPRWDGGALLSAEAATALAIRSNGQHRRVWLVDPDGRASVAMAGPVAQQLQEQGFKATASTLSPNGAVELRDAELEEMIGASDLEGAAILVARTKRTRRRALAEAAEVLDRAGVPCLGVVVL